jgi:hypothetical protein
LNGAITVGILPVRVAPLKAKSILSKTFKAIAAAGSGQGPAPKNHAFVEKPCKFYILLKQP